MRWDSASVVTLRHRSLSRLGSLQGSVSTDLTGRPPPGPFSVHGQKEPTGSTPSPPLTVRVECANPIPEVIPMPRQDGEPEAGCFGVSFLCPRNDRPTRRPHEDLGGTQLSGPRFKALGSTAAGVRHCGPDGRATVQHASGPRSVTVPVIANALARPMCDGANWSSTHAPGFARMRLWAACGEVVATDCGTADSRVAS